MAGFNAFWDMSLICGGEDLVPGSGRLLSAQDTGFRVFARRTATANVTTAWDLTELTFKGRGPLLLLSETNPDGDGNVTAKLDNVDANNVALNIKPGFLLTQVPTTINLINSHATLAEDIILVGWTDSGLT